MFRSEGKIAFTNLSMNEVSKRSGTEMLRRTPKTTLTLEVAIRTCNIIVLTTLTF